MFLSTRRTIGALSILTLATLAFAKDNGFDGKWVLDNGASQCQAPLPENFTQQIKSRGGKLTVESYWREPKGGVAPLILLGLMATRVELASDGSQSNNQVGPFMQVSKTVMDGRRMTTDWTATDNNGKTVSGQWVRTVSDDGKQQTIEVKTNGTQGDQTAHLVFKRK